MPANAIELNREPLVLLERGITCPICREDYHVVQQDREPVCVTCSLAKSAADFIILFGWKIVKTPRQVVVIPLRQPQNG